MQPAEVLKGVFVFVFTIVLTDLTRGHKASRSINNRVNFVTLHFPRTCRVNDFINFDRSKAPHLCQRAYQYFLKDCAHQCSPRQRTHIFQDIVINVRLYKPWHPLHKSPNSDKSQKQTLSTGLFSILEFARSLGSRAKLARDSRGNIIGIDSGGPTQTFSRIHKQPGRPEFPIESLPRRHQPPLMENWKGHSHAVYRGDMDQCCTTHEMFFTNTTLKDIFGKRRDILQISQAGSHQFIRHGVCGGRGQCAGECVQMYVNMALSIHPPEDGQEVTYKFFEIPGYCACKTFG